jgi:hypothetical protein
VLPASHNGDSAFGDSIPYAVSTPVPDELCPLYQSLCRTQVIAFLSQGDQRRPVSTFQIIHMSNASTTAQSAPKKQSDRIAGHEGVIAPSEDVLISVANGGHSFPAEPKDALVEAVGERREDLPTSEGRDLGLSMARSLVQGLGGQTWCEEPADGGLQLCFTLRRAPKVRVNKRPATSVPGNPNTSPSSEG